MNDPDLQQLLTGLGPDEPEPSDRVSIDRAVRSGRRTVYTRRSFGIAAVVTAVLAVIFAPALIGSQLNSEPEPVGPSPRLVPFDPRVREFMVGRAGGFAPAGYVTGRYRVRLMLRAEDLTSPLRTTYGEVTLFAPGLQPYADGLPFDPATQPLATDEIPGVGPYRVVRDTKLWVTLAWQRPDGGWGVVSLLRRDDRPGGEKFVELDRSRAIHLIEAVSRLSPRAEEKVPFTGLENPRTLPKGYSFDGVARVDEPDGTVRSMQIRLAEKQGLIGKRGERSITVGLAPTGSAGTPNTTIGGRPAVQSAHKVTITGVGAGFDLVAESSPNGVGQAELRKLAGQLRLVDGPRNPGNWQPVPN